MNVEELITQLVSMPQDAEIGYEVGQGHMDLLIGEDEKTGEMITIKKPNWQE